MYNCFITYYFKKLWLLFILVYIFIISYQSLLFQIDHLISDTYFNTFNSFFSTFLNETSLYQSQWLNLNDTRKPINQKSQCSLLFLHAEIILFSQMRSKWCHIFYRLKLWLFHAWLKSSQAYLKKKKDRKINLHNQIIRKKVYFFTQKIKQLCHSLGWHQN